MKIVRLGKADHDVTAIAPLEPGEEGATQPSRAATSRPCGRWPGGCPALRAGGALQCGGSDAWSGITANPAVGHACDLLMAQGAAGVLTETPESHGAEDLLTARAATRKVGARLVGLIRWREDYSARNHGSMDNNPSPGTKEGWLTTILEKSLGAAARGGTEPLTGFYNYAERIAARGLTFMDSPSYDPAPIAGQIAAGCNLVVFTTGRGSAFGSKPAPRLMVATNRALFARMDGDMAIDAGRIPSGAASAEEVAREIYRAWLRLASGKASKPATRGLGDDEFVPWRIGAVS